MRQTYNERYHESYFEETLENGLRVVLWQKPDYQKSLFMMAAPIGALDMEQVEANGTQHHFPAGIAHFLEHKMFAMGDEDVMDTFSKMGANVNAFTSYRETAYYFSTSRDPMQPLFLLMDFVQSLDINEASVEKEKGIIIQELHMYKEMSDQRLLMETYSSLFSKHPLRYDIGGDDESVTAIDVAMLETCYNLNYHPSTMLLVGVSNQDPQKLMQEIREHQAKKSFPKVAAVTRATFEEPNNVVRPDYTFTMDVSVPKLNVAYKLQGIDDPYERAKMEWCIRILLDANFTSINDSYQTWLDEHIINDYCGCDIDFGEDYGLLMFYSETLKQEAFLSLIDDVVSNMQKGIVSDATLEQLKRRYFGQSVRSLNSFDDIAVTYVRSVFEGTDFFRSMDILFDISAVDVKYSATLLCKEHQAIVRLLPNENNNA